MKEKFYITTAIAYASAKPHFGNTYEVIMTDAIARYKRQRGYDVFFCTGTDEHGLKIEQKAAAAGLEPKKYVDGVASTVKSIWDRMNASYDRFIRTTDEVHERNVRHIFKKLYDQGDIYKGEYEGWYCTACEAFFTESQLIDGKCPDCSSTPKRAKEEAYFFKMSKYADWLLDYIEKHPGFIEPEARKKEMINNFLLPGLQDLCVSRTSFKWGIPVDFDPGHVVYVWLDALTNYISALGYDEGLEDQPELFKEYWPADVHIIGKDIMRFHTIYWPIFLKALNIPLPKKVFGHPWFNFGEDKMSKSKGNVIYADELADVFGTDGVRYYALSEMPYLNDGSITYESVINRFNTDLANNLGNLVSRTVAMTKKYFDGVIPAPSKSEPVDEDLKSIVSASVDAFIDNMDSFHISDALSEVFSMLKRANKYIDETTPWVLAKNAENKERLGTVLYNLLETIRISAILLYSAIPSSSDMIFEQIGSDIKEFETVKQFGSLVSGNKVGESSPLFSRIDEKAFFEEVAKKAEQMKAQAKLDEKKEVPEKLPLINIDKFFETDLKTAKIIECEPVPKAKKLLKLKLDLGYENRQVVSGIAKYYKPEDLIGKKVIVVSNLEPATLCGVESQGMILASGEEEVRVIFLSDDTPLGERVR